MGLIAYSGGGTKLFQSYLDGHPEVYNIPMYPLLYFYPHWEAWQEQYQEVWNWDTIINIFCIKHSSVIDSRNIIGINRLDSIGESKAEHVAIDGEKFRSFLKQLLQDEPISRRTFLLAVNYAYALCKGEDIASKKLLLWHHHVVDYLDEFLKDFPQATIIATIRDPRIKFYKLYDQWTKVDQIKLNPTDAIIYRWNLFHQLNRYMFLAPYRLKNITNSKGVLFLKHEGMASDLPRILRSTAEFFGIKFMDLMFDSTFDGKVWWVPDVYEMPASNEPKPAGSGASKVSQQVLNKVLSTDWKNQKSPREIFIFEGMRWDFLTKYGYEPFYYKKDSMIERLLWMIQVWFPYQIEIQDTFSYLNPMTHLNILVSAWKEAKGDVKRKYYAFNATYLYKYFYKDLKLWQRPFFMSWLDHAAGGFFSMAAAVLYVAYVYARFWGAIILLPLRYLQRLWIDYSTFYKRISTGEILAPVI